MATTTRRRVVIVLLSFAVTVAGALAYMAFFGAPKFLLSGYAVVGGDMPELGSSPTMPPATDRADVDGVRVEVVARDLVIPWDIDFAPDGRLFFTERGGRIGTVVRQGSEWGPPSTWLDLERATHHGEGGVLGIALHPEFEREPFVYVAYTVSEGGRLFNRVSRFRDALGVGISDGGQTLVSEYPAARFHNGGALSFGPDGMLYVGTGDARNPPSAQDRQSLGGKILRLTPEGEVPEDNPFDDSFVWAYGFRNVSALAWHPTTGELWAASHGPSGEFPGLHARDTVYVVEKGGNHGWPLVVGVSERDDLVPPVLYYPDASRPPGGLVFYEGDRLPFAGDLFMTTLRSAHLQRIGVADDGRRVGSLERWWQDRFGRLRALAVGPEGAIYFTTSNRDGRASGDWPGSDFIYAIVPGD